MKNRQNIPHINHSTLIIHQNEKTFAFFSMHCNIIYQKIPTRSELSLKKKLTPRLFAPHTCVVCIHISLSLLHGFD